MNTTSALYRFAVLLPAVVLFIGCGKPEATTLPFYQSEARTPEWIPASDPAYETIHQIPGFAFTNQDGDLVTSSDLRGHIYVANFFFVHCKEVCPSMRSNLATVQETYRRDDEVLLLSHTVMPEVDTVPVLQNYAKANAVVPGKWHLLTGHKEDIYTLARDAYFAELEEDPNAAFLHTETFVLVDRQARIRGVYNGTLAFDVQRLIEDIATLKQEDL